MGGSPTDIRYRVLLASVGNDTSLDLNTDMLKKKLTKRPQGRQLLLQLVIKPGK